MGEGRGAREGMKRCILHFTLGRGVYRARDKKIFTGEKAACIKGMNVHSAWPG
jgi:hypothetical protein